jgi:crotonobetainyl-CoA:carnitine CoA-transferase CaiB-like acyl-CoA transferase
MGEGCAVLDWAASGAMALTGPADGLPTASPAPAFSMLGAVTEQLARVTRQAGHQVVADPAELIAGRAAFAGLSRRGRVSAGGHSFLLRAADGWCSVTLSRPDDLAAVPAILGVLGADEHVLSEGDTGPGAEDIAAAHRALAAAAAGQAADEFVAAAQLLGVPASALPARTPHSKAEGSGLEWPPWRRTRIAPPSPGAGLGGAVVADLSSMWAGPLCARLLGLAGAQVIKVESPSRPDGARGGNPGFFDWLHAGHRGIAIDFETRQGRSALAALLERADVVIEASRPRALDALGLSPGTISHRDGQVWLSITGYGQGIPDRVAFGDDAAVAGGLVGLIGEGEAAEPVFCADAIADPLTGLCGALAVAQSRFGGGGEHIDLSMRAVSAAFAKAAGPDHGVHRVLPGGLVVCPRSRQRQRVLPPRHPGNGGQAAGAPSLGADNAAVLSWLAGQGTC